MSSINEVLEVLSDGNWHSLTEVSKALKISFEELDSIIHFLNRYGFLEVNDDLVKVKMDEDFHELVAEESPRVQAEIKQKPPMLMTIKGEFRTIECTETEMVVTGRNLEIESMRKMKKSSERS